MNPQATGWAVTVAGVIDVRTVSPTRRAALVNWLVAGETNPRHIVVLNSATDDMIERCWKYLAAEPRAEVLPVNIVVRLTTV